MVFLTITFIVCLITERNLPWLVVAILYGLVGCSNQFPADPNYEYRRCVEKAGTMFERCENSIPTCSEDLNVFCIDQYNNDVRACR